MLNVNQIVANEIRNMSDDTIAAIVRGAKLSDAVASQLHTVIGASLFANAALGVGAEAKVAAKSLAKMHKATRPGAAKPKATKAPKAAAKAQKGKRTPAELASLWSNVLDYVGAHSGQGVEQIAKGMGTSSKELAGPIKKLISGGRLTTTGTKRSTRYHLGRAIQSAMDAGSAAN